MATFGAGKSGATFKTATKAPAKKWGVGGGGYSEFSFAGMHAGAGEKKIADPKPSAYPIMKGYGVHELHHAQVLRIQKYGEAGAWRSGPRNAIYGKTGDQRIKEAIARQREELKRDLASGKITQAQYKEYMDRLDRLDREAAVPGSGGYAPCVQAQREELKQLRDAGKITEQQYKDAMERLDRLDREGFGPGGFVGEDGRYTVPIYGPKGDAAVKQSIQKQREELKAARAAGKITEQQYREAMERLDRLDREAAAAPEMGYAPPVQKQREELLAKRKAGLISEAQFLEEMARLDKLDRDGFGPGGEVVNGRYTVGPGGIFDGAQFGVVGHGSPGMADERRDPGGFMPGRSGPRFRKHGDANICASCDTEITDQYVYAMDQKFHTHHFMCANCQTQLGGRMYGEYEDKPYCEKCVQELFSKKCDACGKFCGEQAFEVSGKYYHDACLVCCTCRASLVSVGIAEMDNKMFCESCFGSKHGRLCAGCGTLLKQQGIQALDKEWHPNCFKCQVCNKPLDPGAKFVQKDGKLLCMADYGALHAVRCSHCNKPILDKEYYKHEKTSKAYHRECAGPAGLRTS